MSRELLLPVVPETITVHLGRPSENAENVTLPFADYIKNVASSEIYPTWPENALRANILAETSFALNRVYTEFYRSRGYDFEITNSTASDQSFVNGRDIFENISQIVDEIFNSYLRRRGAIEPLFALYCDGERVQCNGLSQWGSVSLANRGMSPIEIVRFYYGDNVDIIEQAPVAGSFATYPGSPLSLGLISDGVYLIQTRLNRIAQNYGNIPRITDPEGFFSVTTEAAVSEFQRQFDLEPDGIVGNATWYAIARIYAAVKRLTDVDSEGIPPEDVLLPYRGRIEIGDTGYGVREIQYLLALIGAFTDTVREIAVDGIFGEETEAAVKDFQTDIGLTATGVVDKETYEALVGTYEELLDSLPADEFGVGEVPYPGRPLKPGAGGEAVAVLQDYLNRIADDYPEIPKISVDGRYGEETRAAVKAYQRLFGLEPTGFVASYVWDSIANTYRTLVLRE